MEEHGLFILYTLPVLEHNVNSALYKYVLLVCITYSHPTLSSDFQHQLINSKIKIQKVQC